MREEAEELLQLLNYFPMLKYFRGESIIGKDIDIKYCMYIDAIAGILKRIKNEGKEEGYAECWKDVGLTAVRPKEQN